MNILSYLPTAITLIFLLFVVSYYVLMLIKEKRPKEGKAFSSMTVIIPAHNEERYIAECVQSVLAADFPGEKEIIVVDDGSRDRTYQIVKRIRGITVLQTEHTGKSASLNLALRRAKGQVIAVVDGDSIIAKDSLVKITRVLSGRDVAAACCVVKVRNRKSFLGMWMHIEQIYNSLLRSIFAKVNANVTTPGPLSVYRADLLRGIGGFSTQGFSEDVDVTIRLIRKGYVVAYASDAVSETYMPVDIKGFFRQRTRFAKGMINIFKKHLKVNAIMIDIYTLPLLVFTYVQAVIMGAITIYNVVSGYMTYFAGKGVYFNIAVLKFFFEWFSIVGFTRWTANVLSGADPLTLYAAVGIASTLLTYPLYIYAMLRFDRKIDIWHIIPVVFMFPFWLLVMVVYIVMLPFGFLAQDNVWKKNE